MAGIRRTTAALVLAAVASVTGTAQSMGAPRTLVLRGDGLARGKAAVIAKTHDAWPAYRRLLEDAERELHAPLVAVTDKRTLLPPSGDAHDYYSLSPYWWPDPSKPDGLPYIRRDGETNPESKKDLDRNRVGAMVENVNTLAFAYYFSGDERYAARAGRQLRAWFIDSTTRMTPHLRYAQLVRGNPAERGSGIIDTHNFIDVVDAALLLEGSSGWSAADAAALRAWMTQYLAWLIASPNGQHERAATNNHGSWYAAQTATLALFVGDTALARSIVSGAQTRIGAQIRADGSQPEELVRTRSMHYSFFNAEALTCLAELGRFVGVDLWHYTAPEGGSLFAALDRLATYLPKPTEWPGQQIDAIDQRLVAGLLRRAQAAYGRSSFQTTFAALGHLNLNAERSALLYR